MGQAAGWNSIAGFSKSDIWANATCGATKMLTIQIHMCTGHYGEFSSTMNGVTTTKTVNESPCFDDFPNDEDPCPESKVLSSGYQVPCDRSIIVDAQGQIQLACFGSLWKVQGDC